MYSCFQEYHQKNVCYEDQGDKYSICMCNDFLNKHENYILSIFYHKAKFKFRPMSKIFLCNDIN
jgi:hypothetical protein